MAKKRKKYHGFEGLIGIGRAEDFSCYCEKPISKTEMMRKLKNSLNKTGHIYNVKDCSCEVEEYQGNKKRRVIELFGITFFRGRK